MLKGNIILSLCLSTICLVFAIIWFTLFAIGIVSGAYKVLGLGVYLFVFITVGIILVLPIILGILPVRKFLVIGPSGVYYRKINKTKHFQWSNVTVVEGGIEILKAGKAHYKIPITIGQVTVFFPNEKKVRFNSIGYRNREFMWEDKQYMFIHLFQIYSERGKV